uniref:Uncharacterized protein n=1 Tax=Sinocyclocheilus rhinocerous TaxID=307959 RepID=A0A673JBS3_9TELE
MIIIIIVVVVVVINISKLLLQKFTITNNNNNCCCCILYYIYFVHCYLIWGWIDFFSIVLRITLNGMKVSRPDVRIGRYRMIKHERDKHNEPNPQRFSKIQNTKNTMRKDGISSLMYRVVSVKKYPLYTNISVEIGKASGSIQAFRLLTGGLFHSGFGK